MEVTIVRAVPLFSAGADCATSVENCGESATTLKPHIKENKRNKPGERLNACGEIKQQIPETNKEKKATNKQPANRERKPPKTHPNPPTAMMINDHAAILMLA